MELECVSNKVGPVFLAGTPSSVTSIPCSNKRDDSILTCGRPEGASRVSQCRSLSPYAASTLTSFPCWSTIDDPTTTTIIMQVFGFTHGHCIVCICYRKLVRLVLMKHREKKCNYSYSEESKNRSHSIVKESMPGKHGTLLGKTLHQMMFTILGRSALHTRIDSGCRPAWLCWKHRLVDADMRHWLHEPSNDMASNTVA